MKEISPMDRLREVDAFLEKNKDIETIDLLVPDLNGVLRGKNCPRDALKKVVEEGLSMPLSIALCDIRGRVADIETFKKEGRYHGDPDCRYEFVPQSLARMAENNLQAFIRPLEADGSPCPHDPRTVLETVLARFSEKGLKPVIALESEFYFLDFSRGEPTPLAPPHNWPSFEGPQPLNMEIVADASPMVEEIRKACREAGVALSAILSEFEDGQFEINLDHGEDIIQICEQALRLKQIVKAVARKNKLIASYMAKPMKDRCGSGMHVHVSLFDPKGDNIFAKDRRLLEYATGGLLTHMASSMIFFAPHGNSYRRLVPDNFAPIQPDWGENNRNVAIRFPVAPNPRARRFEHRVAGADANPFLVVAAILAACLDGLENETPPPVSETPEAQEAVSGETLPLRWNEAKVLGQKAEWLENYFPKGFREAYLEIKAREEEAFNACVSDQDIKWYLRIV